MSDTPTYVYEIDDGGGDQLWVTMPNEHWEPPAFVETPTGDRFELIGPSDE